MLLLMRLIVDIVYVYAGIVGDVCYSGVMLCYVCVDCGDSVSSICGV